MKRRTEEQGTDEQGTEEQACLSADREQKNVEVEINEK
jgi:hypothetical protein